MSNNLNNEDGVFYRAAIVTSEHPKNPLDGTVVAISASAEFPLSDSICEEATERATEKFNIDKYAAELRLGTLYFNTAQKEIVGVCWENSPSPHSHGDFSEPVETLPEQFTLTADLV